MLELLSLLQPPNFDLTTRSGKAVFIDLEQARYEITVDLQARTVKAHSILTFKQSEAGLPIFDLVPNPSLVKIDGQATRAPLIQSPEAATYVRVIDQELTAGEHTLEIDNVISTNVKWNTNDFAMGFFMSDLDDRQYLEQYLPTSFEYDNYQASYKVVGLDTSNYEIFSNGQVSWNQDIAEVQFPSYFTTSSFYFHATSKLGLVKEEFIQKEKNGREIPVTVYSKTTTASGVSSFAQSTKKYLTELENDYGPFAHAKVVVYAVGPLYGGMEYCGATITSMYALGHELTHSYFARGVMPANGNSGWLDEAIASWRDANYKRLTTVNFSPTNMGGHSLYRRKTDDRAYTQGRDFMAYLDGRLAGQAGLKTVLASLHQKLTHTSIDQMIFINHLREASGIDFTADFDRSIWSGTDSKWGTVNRNPMHPTLTQQQLAEML